MRWGIGLSLISLRESDLDRGRYHQGDPVTMSRIDDARIQCHAIHALGMIAKKTIARVEIWRQGGIKAVKAAMKVPSKRATAELGKVSPESLP